MIRYTWWRMFNGTQLNSNNLTTPQTHKKTCQITQFCQTAKLYQVTRTFIFFKPDAVSSCDYNWLQLVNPPKLLYFFHFFCCTLHLLQILYTEVITVYSAFTHTQPLCALPHPLPILATVRQVRDGRFL